MKFRHVVYAKTEEETEEAFDDLISHVEHPYPKLKAYFEGLFEMRQRWCASFRDHLPLRGNNTNNYVESQFLVLKDNILNRTKEVRVLN